MMESFRPYARAVVGRYREYRRLPQNHRAFLEHKRQHLELLQPDPLRADDPDLVRALVDEGAVVIREFVPPGVVERIAREVRPTMEAVADDRYGGQLRTRRDDDDGVYRLFGAEGALSLSSRTFFWSPFIAGMANALAAPGMHVKDSYVDYKAKIGGHDVSVDYHIDHWKVRFKAFLLLQDVDEEHAPLVYVAGSHRDEPWRRRWDWAYQHREAAGAVLHPRRVKRVCRRYGYEERVFTGRAGDLILANTRGVHRGTELQSGTRLQLVTLFVMNGPPEYAD
jgi:Phytanoyl-CoA dioxygenase (PhyH)